MLFKDPFNALLEGSLRETGWGKLSTFCFFTKSPNLKKTFHVNYYLPSNLLQTSKHPTGLF